MELVRRSERPYLTVPRDPGRGQGWWAVEVFPAPALVELGRLGRALPYRKGPPEARRAGLKAVEDLADAHVRAYVGLWWWSHGRAATLVAGDDASGAILVPRPGR
jgi:predicted RNase H-like nuclease